MRCSEGFRTTDIEVRCVSTATGSERVSRRPASASKARQPSQQQQQQQQQQQSLAGAMGARDTGANAAQTSGTPGRRQVGKEAPSPTPLTGAVGFGHSPGASSGER